MRRRHLLTLVLIAAFGFGGSFTCRSGDDDDDDPRPGDPPSAVID